MKKIEKIKRNTEKKHKNGEVYVSGYAKRF